MSHKSCMTVSFVCFEFIVCIIVARCFPILDKNLILTKDVQRQCHLFTNEKIIEKQESILLWRAVIFQNSEDSVIRLFGFVYKCNGQVFIEITELKNLLRML